MDLEILILTCEKYFGILKSNIALLDKYWPDHPNVVISSDSSFDDFTDNERYKCCFADKYSERIKKGLSLIKTQNVLLLLDDYFLYGKVENALFDYDVDFDYIRLYKDPPIRINNHFLKNLKELTVLPLNQKCYEINFYPGIWKKESLISIVKDEQDPWELEIMLDKRARARKFEAYVAANDKCLPIKNGIIKGKYFPCIKRFLKKEGALFDNKRKTINFFSYFNYKIALFAKFNFSPKFVDSIKSMSKKKFISDNVGSDENE